MKGILNDIVKSHNGEILEEYKNCRTKLKFRCANNHEWLAQPRKIQDGTWCPTCAIERNRIYESNRNFFGEDTEKSFYWAGFIAADGSVRSNSKLGYSLEILLSTKDIEHLRKFKKDIQSEHPIKTFIKKESEINGRKVRETEGCYIRIGSKQIVSDLERFGIVQAKTYKLDIPDWLKKHDLLNHFLRGYIDGDGCYTFAQNKGQDTHITFCMRGTATFLNSFNDIMCQQKIISSKRKELAGICGKHSLTFNRIQYSGNNVLSKMYNYLYSNATIYLNRKEAIVKKAKEFAVYNNGIKSKKIKEGSIIITSDELIKLASEHKSQAKVAEVLGCTSANISVMTKNLNIRDEFSKAIKGYSHNDIRTAYLELNNYSAVGKRFGISRTQARNIVLNNN